MMQKTVSGSRGRSLRSSGGDIHPTTSSVVTNDEMNMTAPAGYATANAPSVGGSVVSEIIQVPEILNEWIRSPKLQPVLLKIKEHTGVSYFTLDSNSSDGRSQLWIYSATPERAKMARLLVDVNFKQQIKLMEVEENLRRVQSDLTSYQHELVSGTRLVFNVHQGLIGSMIGKGGSRISEVIKTSGATINISPAGEVTIVGPDAESVQRARAMFEIFEDSSVLTEEEFNLLRQDFTSLNELKISAGLTVVKLENNPNRLSYLGTRDSISCAKVILSTQLDYIRKRVQLRAVEENIRTELSSFQQERNRNSRGGSGGEGGGRGRGRGRGQRIEKSTTATTTATTTETTISDHKKEEPVLGSIKTSMDDNTLKPRSRVISALTSASNLKKPSSASNGRNTGRGLTIREGQLKSVSNEAATNSSELNIQHEDNMNPNPKDQWHKPSDIIPNHTTATISTTNDKRNRRRKQEDTLESAMSSLSLSTEKKIQATSKEVQGTDHSKSSEAIAASSRNSGDEHPEAPRRRTNRKGNVRTTQSGIERATTDGMKSVLASATVDVENSKIPVREHTATTATAATTTTTESNPLPRRNRRKTDKSIGVNE
jgi:hypothetical protein